MPKAKRERRERTDNYHLLQQWCRTPEQRLYEGIRPVVLFGIPPAERAQETGLAERSLGRAADAFDTHGIISLFRPTKAQRVDHHRSLPVAMRQLIVDLKAEYADFTDGEIAAICAIQFNGRRPSHHTVKAVLVDGPPPQRTQRQFPHSAEIGTPEERRQAVIRLHAQGWSISTIARYLDVSRPTVYAILKRWVEEGIQWLPDKSHVNTSKPGGLKRPTAPCKGSSGSWMIPSGNLPSGFQITLLARNMRDSRSRSSCPCWKTLLGERSMTSEARAITKRGACAREASSSSLRACFVMLCGSPAWQEEQDRRSFLWIRMLYFFRGATRRAL